MLVVLGERHWDRPRPAVPGAWQMNDNPRPAQRRGAGAARGDAEATRQRDPGREPGPGFGVNDIAGCSTLSTSQGFQDPASGQYIPCLHAKHMLSVYTGSLRDVCSCFQIIISFYLLHVQIASC